MASLAQLLTIGLALMLVCNLVVLPALLTWLDPPEGGPEA
jgi:predicted RND superfamily exporter protein